MDQKYLQLGYKKKPKMRRGIFDGLSESALGFAVLVIVLGITALILNGFLNATDNTTDAYTIIERGLTGLLTFSSFLGLIVIAIVGVALLLLIMASMSRIKRSGEKAF